MRGSSIGFWGRFGRSTDLKRLDLALRAHEVQPGSVKEGAKLTIVRLMKDHLGTNAPSVEAYTPVALLVSYCLLGREHFERFNGARGVREAEDRITAALDDPERLDAQLVLLTLHAGLIAPDVVERFDLSAEEN